MYSIYCIKCKCGEHYIGSTRNPKKRTTNHKIRLSNPNAIGYNSKVYNHLRKCSMMRDEVVLEVLIDGLDRQEARDIEFEYIQTFPGTLNSQTGRSLDRNYVLNRDRERHTRYRKNNPEKERARHLKYYLAQKSLKSFKNNA